LPGTKLGFITFPDGDGISVSSAQSQYGRLPFWVGLGDEKRDSGCVVAKPQQAA
jgi:hypothetical protein